MPIVHGIGDEVIYAALAAAATPIAVALSPSFVRKQPLTFLQKGTAAFSKVLRLLWSKLRLWLLKRAQRVLLALSNRAAQPNRDLARIRDGTAASFSFGELLNRHRRTAVHSTKQCVNRSSEGRGEVSRDPATSDDLLHRSFPSTDKVGSDEGISAFFSGIPGTPGQREAPAMASGRGPSSSQGSIRPPAGEICSVCHDEYTLPCQANCGHWFCAECIMRVWHHGSALAACRCPICRRTITLLLPSDDAASSAAASSFPVNPVVSSSPTSPSGASAGTGLAAPAPPSMPLPGSRRMELLREVAKYNRLFGGVPVSLWQRVLDMPLLLRRMGRDLIDPTRALSLLHEARFTICVACAAFYMLSPFDLIPEGVVGLLGLLDDVVFLMCVAFYLTVLYRATLVSRASAPPAEAGNTAQRN